MGMACAEERLACEARRQYGLDKKRMACQLRSAAAAWPGFDHLWPVVVEEIDAGQC